MVVSYLRKRQRLTELANGKMGMRIRSWAASVAFAMIGVVAWAHTGATGVVLERMQGMSAMGDTIKALTPMMRGQIAYDANKVRREADAMIGHAGKQMTRLFPEGSGGGVSKALPSIWGDWDEFAALAEQLKNASEGLRLSADNGLAANGAIDSAGMMGGTGSVMMGGESAATMGSGMMAGDQNMTAEMIATMPADVAFMMVAQTCSTCHQKFRAEDN